MKRTITIGIALILILAPVVTYLLSPDLSEIVSGITMESTSNSISPVKINSDVDLERIPQTMT